MNVGEIEFYDRSEGATPDEIDLLEKTVGRQLSETEISDLTLRFEGIYRNPPSSWTISLHELPNSFLELLKVSNGGGIQNGDREIGFLGCGELREYLLEYHFPDYLPGCLPFAMNGGGIFYIFDMRQPAACGEYPILVAHASSLSVDEVVVAAQSLDELIAGTSNVEDLL